MQNKNAAARTKLLDQVKLWIKCCGLSGHVNSREVKKDMVHNNEAQKAYWGGKFDEYEFCDIRPTADGRGTTGKCEYINRKGEVKCWQIGNAIWRGNGAAIPSENLYNKLAFKVLKFVAPFIQYPDGTSRGKHVPLTNEDWSSLSPNDCQLATNVIEEGNYATPSWHQDSVVEAACVVSAENMDPDVPFMSEHVGATAGQLAHELGGLLHPYGHRDMVLFNGKRLHGPMAVRKMSNGKKKQGKRASYVHYIRKDRSAISQPSLSLSPQMKTRSSSKKRNSSSLSSSHQMKTRSSSKKSKRKSKSKR